MDSGGVSGGTSSLPEVSCKIRNNVGERTSASARKREDNLSRPRPMEFLLSASRNSYLRFRDSSLASNLLLTGQISLRDRDYPSESSVYLDAIRSRTGTDPRGGAREERLLRGSLSLFARRRILYIVGNQRDLSAMRILSVFQCDNIRDIVACRAKILLI